MPLGAIGLGAGRGGGASPSRQYYGLTVAAGDYAGKTSITPPFTGNGPRTVIFRVKRTIGGIIVGFRAAGVDVWSVNLRPAFNRYISVEINGSANVYSLRTGTGTPFPIDGTWHTAGVAYTGGDPTLPASWTLIRNGVNVLQAVEVLGSPPTVFVTPDEMRLGTGVVGTVMQVCIYNRVLTAPELLAWHNETATDMRISHGTGLVSYHRLSKSSETVIRDLVGGNDLVFASGGDAPVWDGPYATIAAGVPA